MHADQPRVRAAVAATLLVMLWLAPPVRLLPAAAEVSSDSCLTLADQPPASPSALPILERCASLLPGDSELLADLASLYEAAGRFADAEAVYRHALASDPSYADIHVALARRLAARGALGEARAHAQAALRLQPNRRTVLRLVRELSRVDGDGAGRPR
jgi:tetratricopeptide (TPR) repeat protein